MRNINLHRNEELNMFAYEILIGVSLVFSVAFYIAGKEFSQEIMDQE